MQQTLFSAIPAVEEQQEPRNRYEEKKQARIERYRDLAEKNRTTSGQLHNQAHQMASAIPFGQPILVGHHSESRDRNYRNKVENTYRKCFEAHNKAEYYEQRAEAAEKNTAISSDDPDALDKLRARVQELQEVQDWYKQINKIARSRRKNYPEEDKIRDLIEVVGLSQKTAEKIMQPNFCGEVGIAAYSLSNNSGNIRRLKQRIEYLERHVQDETTEEEIEEGITVADNVEDNRIQVFFPGKPDPEIRKKLKQNGFRWAPSAGCWQSYRDSYKLKRIKEILSE